MGHPNALARCFEIARASVAWYLTPFQFHYGFQNVLGANFLRPSSRISELLGLSSSFSQYTSGWTRPWDPTLKKSWIRLCIYCPYFQKFCCAGGVSACPNTRIVRLIAGQQCRCGYSPNVFRRSDWKVCAFLTYQGVNWTKTYSSVWSPQHLRPHSCRCGIRKPRVIHCEGV